mmetsp:Transcript_50312/g.98427  ORF Transcript_50312/g.98427 Transcript_50312/m.98427 type:complete len:86 (-) Transcript_50312:55-312(-)
MGAVDAIYLDWGNNEGAWKLLISIIKLKVKYGHIGYLRYHQKRFGLTDDTSPNNFPSDLVLNLCWCLWLTILVKAMIHKCAVAEE